MLLFYRGSNRRIPMTAELKFNLPEENHEFLQAAHAAEFVSCIWQAREECRRIIKYQPSEKEPFCIKTAEHIMELLYDCPNLD